MLPIDIISARSRFPNNLRYQNFVNTYNSKLLFENKFFFIILPVAEEKSWQTVLKAVYVPQKQKTYQPD